MKKNGVFLGGFFVLILAMSGCSSKSKGGSVKSVDQGSSQSSAPVAERPTAQISESEGVIEVSTTDSPGAFGVLGADQGVGQILVVKHDFGNHVRLPENGIYEIILTQRQVYQRVDSSIFPLNEDVSRSLSEDEIRSVLGQSHCEVTSANITEETRYQLNWIESGSYPRGDTESGVPFVRVSYHGHRLLDEGEENSTAEEMALSCDLRSNDNSSRDELLGQIFSNHIEVSENLGRDILFQMESALGLTSESGSSF